jgi:cytochrome c biogenesis protein CcdA
MDTGEFFASTVTSGALLIAIPLAMTAGLACFLSPCILPLIPGYLDVSSRGHSTRLDKFQRSSPTELWISPRLSVVRVRTYERFPLLSFAAH